MTFKLIEIGVDGLPCGDVASTEMVAVVCQAMAELYTSCGFERPWIGYLAVRDGRALGTCGFKSPPVDRRVELAYFTFAGYEGQGIATEMARRLLALAHAADPSLQVAAQTLPEENASTTILRKLNFQLNGTVEHPEDGLVWEWRKTSESERDA